MSGRLCARLPGAPADKAHQWRRGSLLSSQLGWRVSRKGGCVCAWGGAGMPEARFGWKGVAVLDLYGGGEESCICMEGGDGRG